ncbi:uncharacterized protein BXZ73DRAFT_43468 [Epithele typhae]|uniref:uncharacterized protein n=1 Tax=Epithele typhae TaxID=378194 RepID=UPI00200818DE|nr:uncharacterized protein BXZ73DRAFT_43468 [Epithele typhae]KAH9939692.1 hypothetical protein BXZ73DRAFT_43468 [Epithele typhae]
MKLVSAVYLLCKRTTSHSRAEKYRHYVAQWLCGIQKLYPSKYSHRTNNHVAFHIYDFLRLFGPVYLWWCFPFERLIGRLQRIPHNDKIGKFHCSNWFHRVFTHFLINPAGEAEVTMLQSFLRAARLRRWLLRPDCPSALREVKRLFHKAFGSGSMESSSEVHGDDAEGTPTCYDKIPDDLRQLLTPVECDNVTLVARHRHNNVIFARASTHAGNSLVCFYRHSSGEREFGSIKYIYKVGVTVKFAVQSHLPARHGDPFLEYKDFPATTRSQQLSSTLESICPSDVTGHFAR